MNKWDITSQYIGNDIKIRQVYRSRGGRIDHEGNREDSGCVFYTREAAQKYADKLNAELDKEN